MHKKIKKLYKTYRPLIIGLLLLFIYALIGSFFIYSISCEGLDNTCKTWGNFYDRSTLFLLGGFFFFVSFPFLFYFKQYSRSARIGLLLIIFFGFLWLLSMLIGSINLSQNGVSTSSHIYLGDSEKIAINRVEAFRIDSRKTYTRRVGCNYSMKIIIEDKKEIEISNIFANDPNFIKYLQNDLKIPQQAPKKFECYELKDSLQPKSYLP